MASAHLSGGNVVKDTPPSSVPDDAQIWSWLAKVPDPEIPVISIVDLGIIRGLQWLGTELQVTVSPTYTGCPATNVIAKSITDALRAKGIAQVTIKTQIAPPWTTAWMTASGRAALERYGIAPPEASGVPARCPQCQSKSTQKISQFGSTPCKALWRCEDCGEPFDYFKCI